MLVRHYPSPSKIPPDVLAVVKNMGHVSTGALRFVATRQMGHIMEECLVVFEDDQPIGWAALYTSPYCSDRRRRPLQVGFWIKTRYRGRGFGAKLMLEAHNRWAFRKPQAYGKAEAVWQALDVYARLQAKLVSTA